MRGGYKDNLGMVSGFFHGDMLLDPSSEPSHRYGSCEGSQCMFSLRDKRDYLCIVFDIPSYLELCHPNHLGVASVLVRSGVKTVFHLFHISPLLGLVWSL